MSFDIDNYRSKIGFLETIMDLYGGLICLNQKLKQSVILKKYWLYLGAMTQVTLVSLK